MNATVIGVLAIVIGLLACFAGYRVFRIVLPILGFLVGLGVGAQLASVVFSEPYLGSPLSWAVAIVVGLLAAVIAFVWWYVSVALAIAGLGYAIGYGAAAGLGVAANTAVVIGVALAVLFAVGAIVLRIPTGIRRRLFVDDIDLGSAISSPCISRLSRRGGFMTARGRSRG